MTDTWHHRTGSRYVADAKSHVTKFCATVGRITVGLEIWGIKGINFRLHLHIPST